MTDKRVAAVVEDDADISMLLRDVLEMAGFTVHEAPTGRAGIDLVRLVAPDLVTLDLGLPDVDGITVCRTIREFTDAYVLMITARTDEIDRLLGLEIGADDFVDKPFSPREIQARVAALFRRPRRLGDRWGAAGTGPRRRAPGRPARRPRGRPRRPHRHAGRRGAPAHPDRVRPAGHHARRAPPGLDPRDPAAHASGAREWASDHHLVEVHVGNLRRKLGDDARTARWIKTVRGVGYRLAPGRMMARPQQTRSALPPTRLDTNPAAPTGAERATGGTRATRT